MAKGKVEVTPRIDRPVHVMQIVGDPVGGIRKHVHSIINGLDAASFVQSYAYSTIMQDEQFRREIGSLRLKLKGVVPLAIRKKPHPSDLLNLAKLIRFCCKYKVDIVHGHGAKGGMYARLVARICRIPAIYTPHGGVAHSMFGYWEDRLYTFVEKCLIRFTRCYIFESKYTADSFQSKVGKITRPWLVNYNGIASSEGVVVRKIDIANEQSVKNIGVFAILRREKGQLHLINAVATIINSGQASVRLHIFGNGPDREALESQVKNLGITGQVIFYGDVANSEPEIAKMDIIVIPSLFESFGYVGLEAMSLGKPIIASAVGGLLEILDDTTAQLVPPGDEMALSKAIVQCIQNPESSAAMAQRGLMHCEAKFSLRKMIRVLSNQYQSLVLP